MCYRIGDIVLLKDWGFQSRIRQSNDNKCVILEVKKETRLKRRHYKIQRLTSKSIIKEVLDMDIEKLCVIDTIKLKKEQKNGKKA